MERDHHAGLQVQEVSQHPVRQLRGEYLKERHGPIGPADLEHPPTLKCEAVRGDEVLTRKPGFPDGVPGKTEFLIVRGVEHLMQHRKPLIAVQRVRPDPQRFEVGQHIRFDALQTGLGLL